MKKIFILFAAMIAAVSVSADTVYKKVTVTPEDWTGTYLIVCEEENVVFNGGADEENLDTDGGPAVLQDVTFSEDGKLDGTDALDAATFTISATDKENWPWAILSKSGYYIGHKEILLTEEDDPGLSVETEVKGKCKQTLSIDENGNFVAVPKYDEETAVKYTLQYNKKKLQFRYYTPGDKKEIQIYKLDTASSINEVKGQQTSTTVKQIENGQLVILKNGVRYNALGARVQK